MLCGKRQKPPGLVGAIQTGDEKHNQTFDQIISQYLAKRALTIAAARGHHMLMVCSPAASENTIEDRCDGILPCSEPYQTSISPAAIRDGGQTPTLGEISLSHCGVIFLDELPHFKPSALHLLREPIETGEIAIARASYRTSFPCRF